MTFQDTKTGHNAKKSSADPGERDSDADLIAQVSHELRLPIANIKLLIETLLDGAVEDQETARRMLTRAQSEVERLQHLVVNLLSMERVAATRRQIVLQPVLLKARAEYAVETVNKIALEKRISISVKVAENFTVYANAEQLDQVVLNLLENAVKFTPEGGQVMIRSLEKEGMFAIEDTGIGISSSEIPKIFQRFYRVDRAQSRGSTGLGLSIVKHIVDLHGAKINVTSKEGVGSTFQLEFPEEHTKTISQSDPESSQR